MALHSYRIALGLGAALLLVSCNNAQRLTEIGTDPKLDGISRPGEQNPVSVPMPQASGEQRGAGSLWVAGSRAFFRDPRASKVGDIITVDIAVADTAKLSNSTTRTRTNTEDAGMTNMFGIENLLPSTMSAGSLLNTNSDVSNAGTGAISRSEAITMTMAALVTQTLPNGNLVIGGHQQVRVNGELRDLQISGIVRIEDITSDNTVNLTQIAEARISYGGRGTMSDVQSPRWGSQLFDALLPW
ncbi:MAG: flagellar basal body L-ring protein FlgH [Rhizomicrobium sp.]